MNRNIKIEYEQRYKTFDDRIVWNLPIFYNSTIKTYGYFVVDSHGYNDDGTVDESTINTGIHYTSYPSNNELQYIADVESGAANSNTYTTTVTRSYSELKEDIRVYNLLKEYTNKHPLSLKPYDTINEYLAKKAKDDYDRFHTMEYEISIKEQEIAYDRWIDECSGLEYKGAIVDTDEVSQNKIMGAVIYANTINDPNYTCRWKCLNGVFIDLNQAELNELGSLMRAHIQECYIQEEKTLAQLRQCKDKDSVKEIYYQEVHHNYLTSNKK